MGGSVRGARAHAMIDNSQSCQILQLQITDLETRRHWYLDPSARHTCNFRVSLVPTRRYIYYKLPTPPYPAAPNRSTRRLLNARFWAYIHGHPNVDAEYGFLRILEAHSPRITCTDTVHRVLTVSAPPALNLLCRVQPPDSAAPLSVNHVAIANGQD